MAMPTTGATSSLVMVPNSLSIGNRGIADHAAEIHLECFVSFNGRITENIYVTTFDVSPGLNCYSSSGSRVITPSGCAAISCGIIDADRGCASG